MMDLWDLDCDNDDNDDNLKLNGINRPGVQAQQAQFQPAAE